jgi:hypothetical protein
MWLSQSGNAASMTKTAGYPARIADIWSEPQNLPHPVSTQSNGEYFPNVSSLDPINLNRTHSIDDNLEKIH